MNPITIAVSKLHFTIPPQVLQEAFRDTQPGYGNYATTDSLDARILNRVVKPRVLMDANLVGGQHAIVPLDGLAPVFTDGVNNIFEIPKSRTNGLSILSVLSVGYLPQWFRNTSQYGGINNCANSDLSHVEQRIYDSMASIPPVTNAFVELKGENVVLVRNTTPTMMTYFLRCVLTNDPNLNNINPRSIPNLSKLVELAVKSYIYNTMIIRMGQAYLQGGQELGEMKMIIEGYSDSEEMYQTYLRETWQATAFANDIKAYDRFIRLQISPGL